MSYLAEHLPQEVELHGLYGLESRIDGEPRARADSERWRPVIDEVVAATPMHALGPAGVDIEHKGLSLTLHFRRVPDAEDAAVGVGPSGSGSHRAAPARGQDVARAAPAGGRRQGHGRGGALRGACERSPTSATTSATSPRSRRSTAWPSAGSPRSRSRCAPPTRRSRSSRRRTTSSTVPKGALELLRSLWLSG